MKIDPANYETPFDIVYLPSQGLFYPNKKSSLMIKQMTAREENILTSPSLHQEGQALKMVLKSVIADEDVDINNLLVCDKDAIILYLRSTSYGNSFPLKFKCTQCGNEEDTNFLLSSLESNDMQVFPDEKGEFAYELPKSKIEVRFRPLTMLDEILLEKELEDTSTLVYGTQIKKTITTRYALQLTSANGNRDKKYIGKVIQRMSISDSSNLREYIKKTEPSINKEIQLECSSCNKKYKDELYINSEFLGITPEYKKNIMEEVFLLTYYSKGGVNREQAMRMSVNERRWTIQRISEEIEKQNKAEEDAVKKSKSNKRF